MFSHEENELLVRVGPGKPMGELLRRFWLPALLAEELPTPDCTPVRVRVLGEDLVAFRDTNGRVGIVDAYCPHRGAPMFFGRNEEGGLRCIYHAWKFDVEGTCTDIPSCPEGETFKNKVRITAYPAVERAGMIWVYMGPKEHQPPLPGFDWFDMPANHVFVTKFLVHCSFLQSMEGDYDPGHLYLHHTLDQNRNNQANQVTETDLISRMYQDIMLVEDAPHGIISASEGPINGKPSVRLSPWMAPIFPTAGLASPGVFSSNMRVPIDDEWNWWFRLRWSYKPLPEKDLREAKYGGFTYPETIPGTYRAIANKENDYLIDRNLQRTHSVSGIKTFPLQDLCVQENQWGPVAKRYNEHLQSTDRIIIQVRRRLLKMVRELQQGKEPEEPRHPEYFKTHMLFRYVPEGGNAEQTLAEMKAEMLSYGAIGGARPAEPARASAAAQPAAAK
jgi:phthalate 4,5-dioxygenase oxygenase subunit